MRIRGYLLGGGYPRKDSWVQEGCDNLRNRGGIEMLLPERVEPTEYLTVSLLVGGSEDHKISV